MKALIQRVKSAEVIVDNESVGKIEAGILAYIGLGHDGTLQIGKSMIDKILAYRIFEDEAGKLSLNVQQTNGGLLLVSQFTLMANTGKGLRPDFKPALAFADADILFAEMVNYAQSSYPKVATGSFGADMQVHSVNDGPINFLLEK